MKPVALPPDRGVFVLGAVAAAVVYALLASFGFGRVDAAPPAVAPAASAPTVHVRIPSATVSRVRRRSVVHRRVATRRTLRMPRGGRSIAAPAPPRRTSTKPQPNAPTASPAAPVMSSQPAAAREPSRQPSTVPPPAPSTTVASVAPTPAAIATPLPAVALPSVPDAVAAVETVAP